MSLFGDEDNQPWSMPEPKLSSSNSDRIGSLLAGVTVPTSYTQAFDETSSIGGFATVSALEQFLSRSGISASQQESVKRSIGVLGSSGNSVSRDAWNVAMALVALAQRGEQELDLDAVDFVRNNLPELQNVSLNNSATPITTSTTGWTAADSPLSGSNLSTAYDTPIESSSSSPPPPPAPLAFPQEQQQQPWSPKIKDPAEYNPIAKDTIQIRILPEKEGMFMFRHVVYVIEGFLPNKTTRFKVVRRYSDFLWLLECLVKMYPFRLLPVLPPKRLTVDGRYLSSDSYFLERRRRGLTRFVNQLVKHPLLRQEKLVQMFLTVDTELSVWRKQSSFKIEEEFVGRVISQQFIDQWDERSQEKKWDQVRQGSEDALEILSQLVLLVDRICKRQEAMSADFKKLATAFNSLKSPLSLIYTDDTDIGSISEGLSSVNRYATNGHELFKDESQSVDISFLEDVKQMRELINSIRELFFRREKLGGNNIPQLRQRIESNEQKLKSLRRREDSKPNEIHKLQTMVSKDKQSIEDQTNRDWLIKECLTEELLLCQRTQYQLSKLARDWASDLVKYSELQQQNWTELNNDVSHMPLIQ